MTEEFGSLQSILGDKIAKYERVAIVSDHAGLSETIGI